MGRLKSSTPVISRRYAASDQVGGRHRHIGIRPGCADLLCAVLMIKCPKCRRKFPDASIDANGVLCPGCGSKVEIPAANSDAGDVQPVAESLSSVSEPRFATVGECKRCRGAFPASQLIPVPLVLRIVAFPLILLMLLHHPWHIARHGPELVEKFCPRCQKRQAICYSVVGIWSSALVVGLIYELIINNR